MGNGQTRRELMRAFLSNSPMVLRLGIELVELGTDRAELRLPFSEDVVTIGDVVHGGAIATLVDTAGTAAAWADDSVPDGLGGSTVALALSYVSAARAADVTAVAEVVRRGRSLCFVDVTARMPDGVVVAKGQVTYRFSG
jgi:uncharacterized protein (TIGR00369 family)